MRLRLCWWPKCACIVLLKQNRSFEKVSTRIMILTVFHDVFFFVLCWNWHELKTDDVTYFFFVFLERNLRFKCVKFLLSIWKNPIQTIRGISMPICPLYTFLTHVLHYYTEKFIHFLDFVFMYACNIFVLFQMNPKSFLTRTHSH